MKFMFKLFILIIVGLIIGSVIPKSVSLYNPKNNINIEFDTYSSYPIVLEVGYNIITYIGKPTFFEYNVFYPEDILIEYSIDFNEDGVDDHYEIAPVGKLIKTSFTYESIGTYKVILKANSLQDKNIYDIDFIEVCVNLGNGSQQFIKKNKPVINNFFIPKPGDGIRNRYSIMINGGYEERFWEDVNLTYTTLINYYKFNSKDIFLLNYNGTNPEGKNPDNMIDYSANYSNVLLVFYQIADIIDDDDLLFIWVTDHGIGYFGPQSNNYGFLYSDCLTVNESDDEKDYLEKYFKLRSLFIGGYYSCNFGMNEWKVYYDWAPWLGCYSMYRIKYVSHFSDVYFEENNENYSDDDVLIERYIDYLQGDFNRDGYINESIGECYDFDKDAIPPYNPIWNIFDEDDWGEIDFYYDNYKYINTGVPGENYTIFDFNLDNHLDIDINSNPNNLEVDGTDIDNKGLFDGLDVNSDGDMLDWISIDEKISLYDTYFSDDDLKLCLSKINADVISIIMLPCFSGGFIEDLSHINRIIATACTEEISSHGNSFIREYTNALKGYSNNSDDLVSFVEAFNYAVRNMGSLRYEDNPQYDDNGDGKSHSYPIPRGRDGKIGDKIFLSNAIKIENPEEGYVYLFNNKSIKSTLGITYIFGVINITTSVSTEVISVEFYIDNKLIESVYRSPYYYNWSQEKFKFLNNKHIIKVVAYDINGIIGYDEIMAWKFL